MSLLYLHTKQAIDKKKIAFTTVYHKSCTEQGRFLVIKRMPWRQGTDINKKNQREWVQYLIVKEKDSQRKIREQSKFRVWKVPLQTDKRTVRSYYDIFALQLKNSSKSSFSSSALE